MNKNANSLNRLMSILPAPGSRSSPANGLETLCKIFLETSDLVKRDRAIRKYAKQREDFNTLVENNFAMLTAEVEQALVKLATGYTVTEKTVKTTSRGRFAEEKTRTVPPNQKAVEFYLTNKKAAQYSASPKADNDSEGVIAELMEAFKNVK
ncbi:MAG: hypothetical protein FWE74_07650 [Oscillospiraceae bacterium]|nr:hypothetical protein [Oscillospiraceae bacterium]